MRFKIILLLLPMVSLFSGFFPPESPFFHEGISLEIPDDWKIRESGHTGDGWPFVTIDKKEIGNNGTVTIKWTSQVLDLDKTLKQHITEMEYKLVKHPDEFSYKTTEGIYKSKRALKANYSFLNNTIPYQGTVYCFHYYERTVLYIEQEAVKDHSKNSEGFYTISSSLSCVEETDD